MNMDKVKHLIASSFHLIKRVLNKYVVTLLFFFYILFFLDDTTIPYRYHLEQQIRALKKEIKGFEYKSQQCRDKMRELNSNAANLEKFAREQYLLKSPNEDIFIITTPPTEP